MSSAIIVPQRDSIDGPIDGLVASGGGRGIRPVINVSWDDAKEYVAWLSRKSGKTYRLLSEAEWGYAARAGTTTRFHFGNDEKHYCRYANGADLSFPSKLGDKFCSDGVGKMTAEVGQYVGNNFGLYDMHGNVHEWVEDCYSDTYEGAPSDGAARTSDNCEDRPTRGGSFAFNGLGLQIHDRVKWPASWRVNQVGFRVARTL